MWRRLKEDWNQHYARPNFIDGQWVCEGKIENSGFYADMSVYRWEGKSPAPSCMCFTDPKVMAQFKEQPRTRSDTLWGNPRRIKHNGIKSKLTPQELRHIDAWHFELKWWPDGRVSHED